MDELAEDLLSKIRLSVPTRILKHQEKTIRRLLREQLSDSDLETLTPFERKELAEILYEDYIRSKVEAGKMVGVIAAQTIGEIQTQGTLNSHKTAGLAAGRESFSGIGYVTEIIQDGNPGKPTMWLYPNERYNLYDLKRLITKIQYTIINDLVLDAVIGERDSAGVEEQVWHKIFRGIYGPVEASDFVLRLRFDVQKLYDKKVTLKSLARLIRTTVPDTNIIHSTDSIGIMDVYYHGTGSMEYEAFVTVNSDRYYYLRDSILPTVRGIHVVGLKNIERVFLNNMAMIETVHSVPSKGNRHTLKLNRDAVRTKGVRMEWVRDWVLEKVRDARFVGDLTFTSEHTNIMELLSVSDVPIKFLMKEGKDGTLTVDASEAAKHGLIPLNIQSSIEENAPNTVVGNGIYSKGLANTDISFPSTLRQFLDDYWFIETRGINIEDSRFLSEINHNCTWCNDGKSVLRNMGIEMRRYWFDPALQQAGMANVAREHKGVMFDVATREGFVAPMNMHGLSKINLEFVSHSNFEKNSESYIAAALSGRSDSLTGIAASVLTGNLSQYGTGAAEVVIPDVPAPSTDPVPRMTRRAPNGKRV